GNGLNVAESGAAASTGNIANISSTQLAGNVLKVTGNSLTTGTAINVSATGLAAAGKAVSVVVGTAGTPIFVNTANLYSGNLVDLQVNSVSKFSVDQTGKLTLAGSLVVNGGTITGPAAATFTIDTGGSNALNIGGSSSGMSIGKAATTQALLGNVTVAGTLGVTGSSVLTGNATFGGTITGPAA